MISEYRAAKRLRVSRITIRKWVEWGILKRAKIKVGKKSYLGYDEDELRKLALTLPRKRGRGIRLLKE